ncbi:BZ3500_MvSof-1268-A1-R1_Chr7-3g09663 [Microbotryum saponariae]|uniref:BZ3500_MvSof-1268-A1-R1_Chr7-3g09663 protein n=1 Tax=Microbotryum saponariae TaxID=289078 RepID=A0A2X0MYQ8_9BASI|nr:BZ3501_MvSof-1269-A2-R1_Chr7-2g09386 [Microbotryum saponariae]SDA02370.1 BZ3500_MvSof-1268-A1-R1_Chr7-3g09663 [Microbotryum saponariae]
MSLEATMLVLDNSAYAINGDFTPTRLEAQSDAVHVIFNRKLNAHPESEVGLMVMAGPAPQVLVTPTQDEGKLIAALHTIQPSGQADLETAIKVAQLALKHRQNKNQRQRIIVFCASPISTTSATLSKLGKKMKKNNVAIDIVAFGSSSDSPDDDGGVDLSIPSVPSSSTPQEPTPPTRPETTQHKLTTLYEAVNSSENSHLLFVERGPYLLSERLAQSPILRTRGTEEDYSQFGGGGGQGSAAVARTGEEEDGFGVDPNLDPELAMALRMSLQEERARQAALEQAKANTAARVGAHTSNEEQGTVDGAGAEPMETETLLGAEAVGTEVDDVEIEHDGEEEDDLAKALALSRGAEGEEGDVEMEEEQEMARAIAMSMQEAQEHEATEAKKDAK